MPQKNLRFNWSQLGIRTQINIAMGCVGLLLLVTVVASVILTGQVGGIFNGYRAAALQTNHATEEDEGLASARIAAMKFRANPSEEQKEILLSAIDTLHKQSLHNQEQNADNPEIAETFAAIANDVDDYRSNFEAAAVLQEVVDAVAEQVYETGVKANEILSEIMMIESQDDDATAVFTAATVQQNFSLGRLYLERYLLRNDSKTFNEAETYFDTALAKGKTLPVLLQDEDAIKLADEAMMHIFKTRTAMDRIRKTLTQRNSMYTAMDEIGPRVSATLDGIHSEATALQEALGPEGESKIRAVTTTMEVLGVLSLLIAMIAAWRIGKALTANINRAVETMTELAAGNLDVEVSGQDQANELGEMARALVVFKDNAQEARRLEEEKQQAEARERERQADLAKRERLEAEEARKHAEEERRQLEELEAFRRSLDGVIVQAASGNFSTRLDIDTQNSSYAEMARSINAMMENVEAGLSETARIVREMSAGDLTGRMSGEFKGAFAELQADVNCTLETLNSTVGALAERGRSVDGRSTELQSAAIEMSRRSEQNAASLEETSAALEEMSAGVRQVAGNVSQANQDARNAADAARSGAQVSREAVEALSEINEASRKMENIAGMIEDIAFQINLLALNAGVESARAGEAGRGFAVVASEVRSLAQRSTEAVSEISQVIGTAREKVQLGVTNVGKTQETLDMIVDAVSRVSEQMSSVADSMDQQSTGIGEINGAVSTLDASTQANASASEEVTAASSTLHEDAKSLTKALATFRTRNEGFSPEQQQPAA